MRAFAVVWALVVGLTWPAMMPAWGQVVSTPASRHITLMADTLRSKLRLTENERVWLNQNPIIDVGLDAHFAPYSFLDADGKPVGVIIDYVDTIAQAVGFDVRYRTDLAWPDVLKGVKDQNIDMIATLAYRQDRTAYMLFSDVVQPMPWVITGRKEWKETFSDKRDLKGIRVAIVNGYAAGLAVIEEFPSIQPVLVDTPLQALSAVASGSADAYVGVLGTNTFLAQENGLSNLTVLGAYDLDRNKHFFGVRKDWTVFQRILNKALAAFPQRHRNGVLAQWTDVDAALPLGQGGADDAQSGSLSLLDLSVEELAYAEKRPKIRMCVDPEWMPYERIDDRGQHVGIAAEYMKMFADMIGVDLHVQQTLTWAESEQLGREGKCDVFSLLNRTEKRAEYLNFTDPYIEAPVVLVSRDDVGYLDGVRAIQGKTLGLVDGYVYNDFIKLNYPDVDIVSVKSIDDALTKISRGEIYATIGSLYVVSNRIQALSLANLKIAGHTEFRTRLRVGVRKDDPVLLSLFKKAVNQRDPLQENEILRKWTSVKLETSVDYRIVWQLASVASIIIVFLVYRHRSIRRYSEALQIHNKELERLSITDPLTGVYNRLKLDEVLEYETRKAQRYGRPLSVMVMDLDNFKQINDTRGHTVGDRILTGVARIIRGKVRDTDVFGRWGGEEFILISSETDLSKAMMFAEKIREAVADHDFDELGDQVTLSIGVAAFQKDETVTTLVSRADRALYNAKDSGRNCVRSL